MISAVLTRDPTFQTSRNLPARWLGEKTRDWFINSDAQRTLTSAAQLRDQLRGVYEDGWATAVEELETGLNAVAAPIRGHDGTVIAAISAAGPTYRLSPERLPETAATVVAAGQAISRRMGYQPIAGSR